MSRSFPRARIWLTEYGYQSNPPDKLLGVSLSRQARYVGEGAYVAYKSPRVDLLIHFLYRDEPDIARFQSGLVTLSGKAKPAYAAFELPLAQTARSGFPDILVGSTARTGHRVDRRDRATIREQLANDRDRPRRSGPRLPLHCHVAAGEPDSRARRVARRRDVDDQLIG